MNADNKTATKKCAGCGATISAKNMGTAIKEPGANGRIFPVCSDVCSKKICDSLASQFQSQGRRGISREDALVKSFGLQTAREQQIAKETDRFLRELGL